MGDRIVFLGTGGDAIVVGKQYRASGGIILEIEDSQLHLDPGPGALVMAKLYDINLRENTAVLISHNHIIHANDANAVISAMTHNGLDKKGVLIANKTSLEGSSEDGAFVREFYKQCVERIISVEPGSKIGIKDIDIMCTATKHNDPQAVGFKFFTSRYTIGYTSDTGYSEEIASQFEGTDILIMNVTYPENIRNDLSLNVEDAISFIKKVKPRLAITTHFGIKMLQADPLYEARQIQKETGVEVLSAKDGMIVNPLSFSSSVKQKPVRSY